MTRNKNFVVVKTKDGEISEIGEVSYVHNVEPTTLDEAAERVEELNRAFKPEYATWAVAELTLITDVPQPCSYSFSHTQSWCGNPRCRIS